MSAQQQIQTDNLETLIQENMALIIRTVSAVTGRYVSVENDDEFSVALDAFAEAVERFTPDRGSFASFAALVIRSRVINYLQKENKYAAELSLESMQEDGQDLAEPQKENLELKEEIGQFVKELEKFDLTLDELVSKAPKHTDTRVRAVYVAEKSSQNEEIVSKTYQKKKLPIRSVALFCMVSEKIVKTSKTFILATMLVFVKRLPSLISWIRGVE